MFISERILMFVVKKLSRNGKWTTISLIDENGSFRGEARFSSKHEAIRYLEEYRTKIRRPLDLKVFSEQDC
jgi:hypothetical protein